MYKRKPVRNKSKDSQPATAPEGAIFDDWQQQHLTTIEPSENWLVRTWLATMHRCARPFARAGVSPNTLTLIAVLVGAATVPLAQNLPAVAALLVILAAVVDGLDGAVAAITERSTQLGFVLDSVGDRVSDACFFAALWIAGADVRWCASALVTSYLVEYVRARTDLVQIASRIEDHTIPLREHAIITVAERPTRVIGCAIALFATLFVDDRFATTMGAVIVTLASLVALGQFARHLRSVLRM